MDIELKHSRISVIIHTIAGFIAGYLSFLFQRSLYGLGIAIVILLIIGFLTEKVVAKKGVKWWMGNGGIMYLFIWIVSWVLFFNLF